MFNGKCVGIANATAAGWGNLGGGVTQFVMPLVYAGMLQATKDRAFTAWRWAYIVPGMAHLLGGMGVMFLGQDLPDGNYKLLHTSGALEKEICVASQRDWHEELQNVVHGLDVRLLLWRRVDHEQHRRCTCTINSTLIWPSPVSWHRAMV